MKQGGSRYRSNAKRGLTLHKIDAIATTHRRKPAIVPRIGVFSNWRFRACTKPAKLGCPFSRGSASVAARLRGVEIRPVVPKIIVINDDIYVTNSRELVWAFATRNHPGPKGESIFSPELTSRLVAFPEGSERSTPS